MHFLQSYTTRWIDYLFIVIRGLKRVRNPHMTESKITWFPTTIAFLLFSIRFIVQSSSFIDRILDLLCNLILIGQEGIGDLSASSLSIDLQHRRLYNLTLPDVLVHGEDGLLRSQVHSKLRVGDRLRPNFLLSLQ